MPAKRKCACGRRYLQPRERKCFLCKKETRKVTNRRNHVKKNYELTPEEHKTLTDAADGRCMGCGQTRKTSLHVDHDHWVERENGTRYSIRGLLCASCNGVLRKARDNASTLRVLAHYLDCWPTLALIGNVQGRTIR